MCGTWVRRSGCGMRCAICGRRLRRGTTPRRISCTSTPVPNTSSPRRCGPRASCVRLVHRENIPARPASDWSIVRRYPHVLRPIGPP
eukprot:27139-Prorocentrum_minimum.AAC.1